MRITKLHLLGLFLICALAFSGHYYFKQKKKEMKLKEQQERMDQEQNSTDESSSASMPASGGSASSTLAASTAAAGLIPVNYTVQKGDTFWKIAKMPEHFGAGHRWYDVWKANEEKIGDFDHLEAGMTITIPLDVPEHFPWPATSEERKAKILQKINPQARRAAIN